MNHSPKWEQLRKVLAPSDRVLCLIRPDPDSIASAFALKALLRKTVAEVTVAYDAPSKRLQNRAMVKLLRLAMKPVQSLKPEVFTKTALLDGQANQFPAFTHWSFDLVFDHHPVTEDYPYRFADLRPEYGATSTILEEYLRVAKVKITERLATALCYGIKTDTDDFQREVVRADAEAFSRLFPLANVQTLRAIDQIEIPRRQLEYFDQAMHRLRVKKRRAVVHLGAEESADIAVIIADFLIRVSGIGFAVVSIITEEKLVLVFRNRRPRGDAGRIAHSHFGELGSAGGHASAARAEIPLRRLPAELKVYDADQLERWVEKQLSRPGKPKS